jgi:hypothetical protein
MYQLKKRKKYTRGEYVNHGFTPFMRPNSLTKVRTARQQAEYDEYHKHKANGMCPKCNGKRKSAPQRIMCSICGQKARGEFTNASPEIKQKRLEATKRSVLKVKKDVFEAYGSACKCCGETFEGFLSIDHIGGGGGIHRREQRLTGGTQTYYWLRNHGYPPEFRILCMNCNFARAYSGDTCDPKHPGYLE